MNELCKRTGMHILDVVKCPLHGNSYIFILSRNNEFARPSHVQNLIEMERKQGLLSHKTYEQYAINCQAVVNELKQVCDDYAKSYKIVGYGAAAKGMTLLNFSGICLDYIVDDNPLKQGKFTPGSSLPILSNDVLNEDTRPILFIPLAWNFFDEIRNKIKSVRNYSEDKFCTYFPKVKITT